MTSSGVGVLGVDKPQGPTSHDIVSLARRALGLRRIGHTGTLDPFASGLLLLCVGWATRLVEYLVGLDKVYEGVVRLGAATDTEDSTGSVLWGSDAWQGVSESEIEDAFRGQLGEIDQIPPAYSAKWVDGVRAHDRARRGEEVILDPVRVTVRRIEILAVTLPEIRFEVECSSGTYIRSIARDIGEALGIGAHLAELRRTAIGEFRVQDAIPVAGFDDPQVLQGAWIDPLSAVRHLPRIEVEEEEARSLRHGACISLADRTTLPIGLPLAVVREGRLIAIGEREGGTVRTRKVFPE